MRPGVIALAALMAGCAQTPPTKDAVARLTINLTSLSSDAINRTITPVDVLTTASCDSGSVRAEGSATGTPATAMVRLTLNACSVGSETLTGQLTLTTRSSTVGGITESSLTIDGSVSYVGPSWAGNISYNGLQLTTRLERTGDRLRLTSTLNGSVTVGATTYTYTNEQFVIERGPFGSSDGGAGGGAPSGGGVAGGGSAMGGGVASTGTLIQGPRRITDLAVSGQTVFFSGQTVTDQPALFSANATSTLATVLCTGADNTRLSGVVVDGTTVYALSDTATGSVRKLVRTSTTGIGAACTEVATVDARGFFLLGEAALAKVGDLLVYKAPDGSLKGYSLTSSLESVVAQPGSGFFDTILSTGTIGVVAQAQGGATPPDLKTFTASGLGETVASFSKPDFTVVGTRVLWAVDGSGVAFRFREAMSGATVSMGATANLGVPGRSTMGFCETNDGVSAGVFVAKSADAFAGYYTVGLDSAMPRKVTSQSYDVPVHCAVSSTHLWVVEGDLGGSRNLLRFAR